MALIDNGDASLVLVDLQRYLVIRHFNGHDAEAIRSIAFSPDGKTALSGGDDAMIIHWKIETPSLEELLDWIDSHRVVRELTCTERDLYQIEPLYDGEISDHDSALMAETADMDVSSVQVSPLRPIHFAHVGKNLGEIALGDFDVWHYEGKKGEILNVHMKADQPVFFKSIKEIGQLDTILIVISPEGNLLETNDSFNLGGYDSVQE